MEASLVPHPDTPCRAVRSIAVDAVRLRGGMLRVRYDLVGVTADLVLPPAIASDRADNLWQTTCFEAFARRTGSDAYCEFNVSPSTQWAAYRFSSYRDGMEALDLAQPPQVSERVMPNRLLLHVVLDVAGVADLPPNLGWRLAISAVIEEASGAKSYWALAHPKGKPDFHHADGFALDLPPA